MPQANTVEWTDELVARCAELRKDNWSYRAIGQELKISHNAIIGKLQRAGLAHLGDRHLPSRPRKRQLSPEPQRTKTQAAKDMATLAAIRQKIEGPPPPRKEPESSKINVFLRFREGYEGQKGRYTLVNLPSSRCKFPIDQADGSMKFCGLKQEHDRTRYCQHHNNRIRRQES